MRSARQVHARPGSSALCRQARVASAARAGVTVQSSLGDRLCDGLKTGECSRSEAGAVVPTVERTEAIADVG